ncbi:hypothetical protein, partial [Halioglobus sp. HI00S01]
SINTSGDSAAVLQAINTALPVLHRAYWVHLQSSATSGFSGAVLHAMLARGPGDEADHESEAARLLAGAKDV